MPNSQLSNSVLFAQAMLAAITLAYGSAFLGLWLSYKRPAMRAAAFAWLGMGAYATLAGAALLRVAYAPTYGDWLFQAVDYAVAVTGSFAAMSVVGVAFAVVDPARPRRVLGISAALLSVVLCVTVVAGLPHETAIRVVVFAALGYALFYALKAPASPGRRSIVFSIALFLLRPLFGLIAIAPDEVTQAPWYTALQVVVTIGSGFFTTMALFNIERASALAERLALEHTLAHSQRMDSLGRMAASVAHDFNNILTTVLAAADGASDAASSDADRREAASDIEAAVSRGQSLTQALLTFARPQVSGTEFDPFARLAELRPLLERLVGKSISVRWELDVAPAVPVHVVGDATQFEQMLLNLTANARDAMPEGGTLTVTGGVHEANLAATGETTMLGPALRIVVRDTGCGMSAETIDRIFEPFFTTKPRGRGTGLGLSTAFGFVRNAHGRLLVDSSLGHGSTFTVLLPLREASA